MKSMTGYGKGTACRNGKSITIEIKSVNNRYLEINTRLPRGMAAIDDIIRKDIQASVKRGSVDVFFAYENKSEKSKVVNIDLGLASEYVAAAKKLRTLFVLEDDFQTTALMRSGEVLTLEAEKDDADELSALAKESIAEALENFEQMRLSEGQSAHTDIIRLVSSILELLRLASTRAPEVVAEYRNKLKQRITDALDGVEIDEARLVNEVAFFADKADINEEINRLFSHVKQFTEALAGDGEPQGRKLDFLSQEMNREINTMGSKSNDTLLTGYVVSMKNELEKIKEQIRNVE